MDFHIKKVEKDFCLMYNMRVICERGVSSLSCLVAKGEGLDFVNFHLHEHYNLISLMHAGVAEYQTLAPNKSGEGFDAYADAS